MYMHITQCKQILVYEIQNEWCFPAIGLVQNKFGVMRSKINGIFQSLGWFKLSLNEHQILVKKDECTLNDNVIAIVLVKTEANV